MTRVTVLVQRDSVSAVSERQPASRVARDLLRTADELGVSLEPMHPGVADPELAGYFTVDVPDEELAQQVIARLRACEAIEAAYIKPPEALP